MTNTKCSYRLSSGAFCKRWAVRGQSFCAAHKSDPEGSQWHAEHDASVPPLARLAIPRDLFDVVRESINAVRLGRMTPGQGFAISALANAWIHARKQVGFDHSRRVLRDQMLPALSEEERLAEAELAAAPPPGPEAVPAAAQASDSGAASAADTGPLYSPERLRREHWGLSSEEQAHLAEAHNALREKMGWVEDDGSDLQPLPIGKAAG